MSTTDSAASTDWMAAFVQRALDDHLAEVEQGKHDDECEWHSRSMMCHCSKRRRIAAGHTEPPGELLYRNPLCPRCYDEVLFDGDTFVCSDCCVSWSSDDSSDEGTFTDDYGDLSRPAEGLLTARGPLTEAPPTIVEPALDALTAALRSVGRATLPVGFDSTVATFDEMMAAVDAMPQEVRDDLADEAARVDRNPSPEPPDGEEY